MIACFLICWTPFHVSRMMFVIATKTEKWNKALKEIQTVLHYVSGKKFYYRSVEKCNSFWWSYIPYFGVGLTFTYNHSTLQLNLSPNSKKIDKNLNCYISLHRHMLYLLGILITEKNSILFLLQEVAIIWVRQPILFCIVCYQNDSAEAFTMFYDMLLVDFLIPALDILKVQEPKIKEVLLNQPPEYQRYPGVEVHTKKSLYKWFLFI